ncbi:MAG: hypothetical protein DPW16_07055 [Chloroflexi bacterium]|nr:hypothetical protein [Chloroflexota bacterium]
MANLRLGTVIYGQTEKDKYEVVREIGSGSFGRVYEVKDRSNNRSFALKSLENTSFLDLTERRALLNEGQLALGIDHPNVVKIFYFHNGDRYPDLPPYTLMEYVSGGNLHQLLEARKPNHFFNSSELIVLFTQLCLGMQAINARLVHRDIKPDNILVDSGIYKISDFGLSKVVGAATRSESFKGINHIMYSAPEALRFDQNLPLMDMYSMGIVFFQVATLGFPYLVNRGGDIFEAWRNAHLFQQPLDPSKLNTELDVEVSQIILKMMAKRPNDRYQSWDEVLERLKYLKDAPNNVQGIATLLRRDMESRRKAEREELESQKQSREREESESFIEYSFNQILQVATQLVETFNRSSEFTKLKIEETSRFEFSIKIADQIIGPSVHFKIELASKSVQLVGFNQQPIIKAWGIIKAPSGYGFNLILVATGQDDLYGEWRVVYKSLTYPDMSNLQNAKMLPFELAELPRQGSHLTSGGFATKVVFNADILVPLMEELL